MEMCTCLTQTGTNRSFKGTIDGARKGTDCMDGRTNDSVGNLYVFLLFFLFWGFVLVF